MSTHDPSTLAAELRARAAHAKAAERADLLFLAEEYDRLALERGSEDEDGGVRVELPR